MFVYLLPIAAIGLAVYGVRSVMLTTPSSDIVFDEAEPSAPDEEAGAAGAAGAAPSDAMERERQSDGVSG
jgi:hypothetical protein